MFPIVVQLHPCVPNAKLAKKGSNTKLVIKLAEHSGTGLVVVEGGVEKDANGIKQLIDIIQVCSKAGRGVADRSSC